MSLKDKLNNTVVKIAKHWLGRIYQKIEDYEKIPKLSEKELEEIKKNPYLSNMNTFPKV